MCAMCSTAFKNGPMTRDMVFAMISYNDRCVRGLVQVHACAYDARSDGAIIAASLRKISIRGPSPLISLSRRKALRNLYGFWLCNLNCTISCEALRPRTFGELCMASLRVYMMTISREYIEFRKTLFKPHLLGLALSTCFPSCYDFLV